MSARGTGLNLRAVHAAGVPPNRVFRSGDPTTVGPAEAAELAGRHGLRTALDLRSDPEVDQGGPPSALLAAGVRWVRTPVFGYPRETVHQPRPTTDAYVRYYRGIAEHSAPGCLPAVFAAAAQAADEPFLVSCSAGKDRTGVVIASLLDLAGTPDTDIVTDYAASTAGLGPHSDRFAAKWTRHGWTREEYLTHLVARPDTIRSWLAETRRTYGSVRGALLARGVGADDLTRLTDLLRKESMC
ncbi:hypothetical protein B1H18_01550 [Streptomyces tsukubensis]|uniref:Protein tyrosine phosphatase n=1 Tax=Streptomyces tsukubensis TaxID=83656 RepID=A0A1V4AGM1_9ACTN|nr:hypothetical protein B1H18_01550 [Streptomyces tsukubensis]